MKKCNIKAKIVKGKLIMTMKGKGCRSAQEIIDSLPRNKIKYNLK